MFLINLCDYWLIIDNSNRPYSFIAEGTGRKELTIYLKEKSDLLKDDQMKKDYNDITEFREQIKKGLDLAFRKLLKTKKQTDSFLILSENGIIKKIKAVDIKD
ncbi:MAG: hypothetical protein ABIO55_12260 [Ginsengibacter sp.]